MPQKHVQWKAFLGILDKKGSLEIDLLFSNCSGSREGFFKLWRNTGYF